VFIACVVTFLSTSLPGSSGLPPSSDERRLYLEAQRRIEARDYEEAIAILEPLIASHTTIRPFASFALANALHMSAFGGSSSIETDSHARRAIRLYRTILSDPHAEMIHNADVAHNLVLTKLRWRQARRSGGERLTPTDTVDGKAEILPAPESIPDSATEQAKLENPANVAPTSDRDSTGPIRTPNPGLTFLQSAPISKEQAESRLNAFRNSLAQMHSADNQTKLRRPSRGSEDF
jgi:hypothetical protein